MVPSRLGDIPVNSNQGVVCGPVNPGRAFELNADGVRVHAVEWTPAASPSDAASAHRRLLLVHGLGANTLSWEPVGQPLADHLGAPVTAIDLVGFGRTRAPERAATIATNRRLVTAVLREIGPAVVVGNSMGGSIGIGVTATNPELVDALVLVDPAVPHPNPGVSDWIRLSRMAPVMVTRLGRAVLGTRARVMGPERLVDSSIGWSLHDPTRLDPDLRRRLIALAAERYNYPEAPGAYVEAARSMLIYIARGVRGDLRRAAAARPTLIVQGEFDRLVSMAAARGAAALDPSIDLEVLDNIGHAPQLEDPDRFVAVVTTWLDAHKLADIGAD
jgi:glycerol-3-phosphate dehydrogenase